MGQRCTQMKKIMTHIVLCLTGIVLMGCSTTPLPISEMPEMWRENWAFGEYAEEAWSHCTRRGRVDPATVVALHYRSGSKHDGDRQFYTAVSLFPLDADPYSVLSRMLDSRNAEKRAFAAIVVGELGDRRFHGRLKELLDDPARTGWDRPTVADCAAYGLSKMFCEHDLLSPDYLKLAGNWLVEARRVVTPIQLDLPQSDGK